MAKTEFESLCQCCGTQIDRKRYPCGKQERKIMWESRQHCSHRCARMSRLNEAIEKAEIRLTEMRLRKNISVRYGVSP